jgi:DNA adenine methylase
MKSRIRLTRQDALKFLENGVAKWPSKTLIYLDPPYYIKGRELYYDFYQHEDHKKVAAFVTQRIKRQSWIVSYDNVRAIRGLYDTSRYVTYDIGYSARSSRRGSEIMFFSDALVVPPLVGPITAVSKLRTPKADLHGA